MQKKENRRRLIQYFIFIIIFGILIFIIIPNFRTNAFIIYENQPTPSEGKDVHIRNGSTLNYDADPTLKVGLTAAQLQYRTLIEFNVSSIPSENSITDSKIQLYVSSITTNNITLYAYMMTSSWNETSSSWTNASYDSTWGTEGGDYSYLLDTIFINETDKWYNISIIQATRGWVNSSYPNYGIIIIPSQSTQANNVLSFVSSDELTNTQLRPKIIIEHTSNAPPQINNVIIDSNLTNFKIPGENVNFTVLWTDLEENNAQFFVCNSSLFNQTGCFQKVFCNTSVSSSSTPSCTYTIQDSDNRTTPVWIGLCDEFNCSSSTEYSFNMNHIPSISLIQPNGGDIINQSQGNYLIKFNVSDTDKDHLFSSLYYGSTMNSTEYSIAANLNLSLYCSDPDSDISTQNNCSYSWNTSGIYGNYFLTLIINDSFHYANDSSISSFSVLSILDETAPNITSGWIEQSRIYSGKSTFIYANVTDPNINTVWASINSTPQQNITLTNITSFTFRGSFTAGKVGNYTFKIYASDKVGNTNTTFIPQSFNVTKPLAIINDFTIPASSSFYNVIRASSTLNSTDPLSSVTSYLSTPEGFIFLSTYPQSQSMGDYNANQSNYTSWFISTPLSSGNYTLNVTFTDSYANSWTSNNSYIMVSQSSSQDSYFLDISGYPEVETTKDYFVESFLTNNGLPSDADSISIKIYDSVGNLIVGPVSMNHPTTGKYNYTYTVGSSVNEGQWQTVINATKDSSNYIASEFWKVVGGPFDIRDITIDNSAINALQISVITENTGGAIKDIAVVWNLTREDTGATLDSGSDTFAVNSNSEKTYTIYPSTDYVGQVRITYLGTFSGTEKAGAYKIFSTTQSSGETPPTTSSGGGGGGGGSGIISNVTSQKGKYELEITSPTTFIVPKNVKKNFNITLRNTGDLPIHNIFLSILGIDGKYYEISPELVKNLDAGETTFSFDFIAAGLSGELDFILKINSDELTKEIRSKIIIQELENYFSNQLDEMKKSLDNSKETSDPSGYNLCLELYNKAKSSIEDENFIDIQDILKELDNCIGNLEKISPETSSKKDIFSILSIDKVIIIIAGVFLVIISLLIIILYFIYKKFSMISYLKNQGFDSNQKNDKKSIDSKLKELEKKLGVENKEKINKKEKEIKEDKKNDETNKVQENKKE